jgi:hypothetical protein
MQWDPRLNTSIHSITSYLRIGGRSLVTPEMETGLLSGFLNGGVALWSTLTRFVFLASNYIFG